MSTFSIVGTFLPRNVMLARYMLWPCVSLYACVSATTAQEM